MSHEIHSRCLTKTAYENEVLSVWRKALYSSSYTKFFVKDACLDQNLSCSLSQLCPVGYVLYLAEIFSQVTTTATKETYFEYAVVTLGRLSRFTAFPILVLVANNSWMTWKEELSKLPCLRENIFLRPIDDSFYVSALGKYGVHQIRPKLKHAYGTIQVFNPAYTGVFCRAVFVDIDVFVLRNVDELFCFQQFAVSKRKTFDGKPNYNGGVFSFSPSKSIHEKFLLEMEIYMKTPGPKKFAMQYLLHKIFNKKYSCFSDLYNCVGFQLGIPFSTKCGVGNETDLLLRGKIIHGKISSQVFANILPSIYDMWHEEKRYLSESLELVSAITEYN
mmetsp:Transcript_35093/g.83258  ORF Transcript_35093/g.83258 Transcript_35093/m.83258 type:complete len:332 (+) Transcript_35093:178-1173(+)